MGIEIIGYIETKKAAAQFRDKKVYTIYEIPKDYDFIIVANAYGMEIYTLCVKSNIDLSRFIFLHPLKCEAGCIHIPLLKEVLGKKNFDDYCAEFNLSNEILLREDILEYKKLNTRVNFEIRSEYLWPIVKDKYVYAGTISNYFWQDLWAARLIYRSKVNKHFDIGSRVDGFLAHLLAMDIDVTVIDIRKFPGKVEGLHTIVDDATKLEQVEDNSIESMSALCSLEHFGLGRYGDPIDPEACFKCFKEIQRKIMGGGKLIPFSASRTRKSRVQCPSGVLSIYNSRVFFFYAVKRVFMYSGRRNGI